MRVNNFSNYTKMYETKLQECEFFREQNITADDIINPLEGLVTQEFLDFYLKEGIVDWAKNAWAGTKKVFNTVKDAISAFFGKVVDFFKNFSLSKLISGIWNKIKEIGSKTWNSIKEALGSLKEFIIGNDLVDENNKPKIGNIWSTLCQKGKDLINWEDEGVTPEKLAKAGDTIKINESDSKSIGDDEVKYYGMFEKIAHAMGIKNARFNGVVSQIMKKGLIGMAIMGILTFAGFSLGVLTLGSPLAMLAVGGMLLMAGLIILSIWVCKPYPTVDDCLAYLHIAFGGNTAVAAVPNMFVQNINYYYITNTTITNTSITNTSISNTNNTNNTSLSNTNNTNNTSLSNTNNTNNTNNIDISNTNNTNNTNNIDISNTSSTSYSNSSRTSVTKSELRVGQEYIYTSKKGERIVKVVSVTHDVLSGKDKKWGTSDDKEREKLKDGYVDVIYQDKNGEYTTTTNFTPILISKLIPLGSDLQVGQEYIYTNTSGTKRVVKLLSLTDKTRVGKDKKWGTKDDVASGKLSDDLVSVAYKDKDGRGYSTTTDFMPVPKSRLSPVKESHKESLRYISSFEKYNNK